MTNTPGEAPGFPYWKGSCPVPISPLHTVLPWERRTFPHNQLTPKCTVCLLFFSFYLQSSGKPCRLHNLIKIKFPFVLIDTPTNLLSLLSSLSHDTIWSGRSLLEKKTHINKRMPVVLNVSLNLPNLYNWGKNRTVVNTHKVWHIKSLNVWNHFEVKISGRRHDMIPTHGTTSIFYSYSQLS